MCSRVCCASDFWLDRVFTWYFHTSLNESSNLLNFHKQPLEGSNGRRRINLALKRLFHKQWRSDAVQILSDGSYFSLNTNNKVSVEGKMAIFPKKRAYKGHRLHALPTAHAHPLHRTRAALPPRQPSTAGSSRCSLTTTSSSFFSYAGHSVGRHGESKSCWARWAS